MSRKKIQECSLFTLDDEIDFKNYYKLFFVKKVRDKLSNVVENVQDVKDTDFSIENNSWFDNPTAALNHALYDWFIPFCEKLDIDSGSSFDIDDEDPDYLTKTRIRFLDVSRFMIALFASATKLLEQAIKTGVYDGILDRYDHIAMRILD